MGITRPTGEQLRFRSATTGDHILDTYMENSEKGSRTLPDLMDDLFDSSGVFRSANFEFRFDATTDKIQFRAGNFATQNAGWTDITTFFNITGTFSASTTYNNFDLIKLTNKDVYIVHGLSSGTTFADEAAVIASANTEKLVDVSEARDWASKTDGQVVSTDYSSKAYAVGGTGVDTTTGSAKDWAIKTSSTVGNTGEYSAKYWATSTAVTTVSSGIANINTVAAAIASVNTTASNISNVNTVAGISADVTTVANIDGNVSTVAGISANTTTVAGIAPNVTTVAGVATNVTTVAGISGNVTTVANNNTNVTTVATNVADVNTVATEINNNNLQTVANDIAAVITLADDLNEATSEIDTVANSITNVDAVGNDITNVNTVATNIANVNTSATNIANVNTVAGISANVTTVAGISADVTTAATNNANITTVAGISSNVTTVAGISANVTTVAGISADVTTAATNVVAFNNTYLGAQASAPTADPDGSALDVGDLYFDTTSNTMKVYAQSGWTAAGSSVNGTADRFNYTATAGQTTFTGADDNNNTLSYDAGFADIYMNGVKLAPADYTANSGSSVILASGAALNDTIEIIAYGTFTLANHSLNDLTDVTTTNNADHKILTYNVANQQFEPRSTAVLTGLYLTGSTTITDNSGLYFGTGLDLAIFHDAGTGDSHIQETGTGDLRFDTNNTTRMRLDQSGRLKIGTASNTPASANEAGIVFGDNTAGTPQVGVASFVADGAAPLLLTRRLSDGNVLGIADDTTTRGTIKVTSGDLDISSGANLRFSTGGGSSYRGMFHNSGAFLLGTTSNQVYYNNANVYNSTAVIKESGSNEVADLTIINGNNNFGSSVDFARTNSANKDVRHATISSACVNNTDGTEAGNIRLYTKNTTDTNVNERVRVKENGDVLFFDDDGSTPSFTFDASDANITLTRNGTFAGTDNTQLNFFHYNDSGNPTGQIIVGGTTNYTGDMAFKVRGGGTSGSGGAGIYEYMRIRGNEREVVFNRDGNDHDFRVESDNNSYAFFINAANDQIMFGDSSINSTQAQVGISLTTAAAPHIVIGNTQSSGNEYLTYYNRQNNDGGILQFRRGNATKGSVNVTTSGTTYNTTSDRRLKTDIEPIEHATDMLMAMNPVSHRWKADPDADAVVGFIAQEMQEIVPEAVSGEPEGDEMMSMDYGRITPVLVAALQDAHKKIDKLKAEIAAIKEAM